MEKEAITRGAVGGLIGGIVMAMFAMIAGATYLGTGFFTPMYHIASFLTGPEHMEASMGAGTMFYFSALPATLGLMIHMTTAIGWGILLALAVNRMRAEGGALVVLGLGYGLVVMAFMSFVALPIIGQADMPKMVGWTTFSVEHALYGMSLGSWLALAGAGSRSFDRQVSGREVPAR